MATAQPSNPTGYNAENLEGYRAYMEGRPFTDNPYPFGTAKTECTDWARGYAAARTDKARANRGARA